MDLRIVVNWAPYPEGSARAKQQCECWGRLIDLSPSWVSHVVCVLPGERLPDLGSAVDSVILPRDAFGEVAGKRHLPFVDDVMDAATDGLPDDVMGGLLNSDILVTPAFFEAFEKRLERAHEVVLCHRTDIRHPGQTSGSRYGPTRTIDGFFVRARTWERCRAVFPELVLAEPSWDTVAIFWVTNVARLPTLRMNQDEILHLRHPRMWSPKSRGAVHNSQVGRWLSRSENWANIRKALKQTPGPDAPGGVK